MYVIYLFSSSAGLDVAPLTEEASVSSQPSQGRVSHQDEPLDGILSPELDKMVTDGQCACLCEDEFCCAFSELKADLFVFITESILSRLYKIPGKFPPPSFVMLM